MQIADFGISRFKDEIGDKTMTAIGIFHFINT